MLASGWLKIYTKGFVDILVHLGYHHYIHSMPGSWKVLGVAAYPGLS